MYTFHTKHKVALRPLMSKKAMINFMISSSEFSIFFSFGVKNQKERKIFYFILQSVFLFLLLWSHCMLCQLSNFFYCIRHSEKGKKRRKKQISLYPSILSFLFLPQLTSLQVVSSSAKSVPSRNGQTYDFISWKFIGFLRYYFRFHPSYDLIVQTFRKVLVCCLIKFT